MAGETDTVVGTIQLTHSTSLVFSKRPWKGRMLAHVRKFVSGTRYEGPTKSGLVMAADVLALLIEALARLRAEAPGVSERQFAKVHKSRGIDLLVSIVSPDDSKALPSVDVREYVHSESYTGPTKKGVRFPWDKLPEFIAILQTQARQLQREEDSQPSLLLDSPSGSISPAQTEDRGNKRVADPVLRDLLPHGPRHFPHEFLAAGVPTLSLDLPSEPITVAILSGGAQVVRSDFGFRHKVRNGTEGNFIIYAHLQGHRTVSVPSEMIDIFRAVKAYENYLRDLRHALIQAYERKTGHRAMAEHQTKEVFKSHGLPWHNSSESSR